MPATKIPDRLIRESAIGSIYAAAVDGQRRLAALQRHCKDCFVISNGDRFTVDPFGVSRLCAAIDQDPVLGAHIPPGKLQEAMAWAGSECEREIAQLENELQSRSAQDGFALSGRVPLLLVDGFLQVSISLDSRACQIGSTKIHSLAVNRLWPVIQEEVRRERSRSASAVDFIDRCLSAYERGLLLERKSLGEPLAIGALHRELLVVMQTTSFWRSPKSGSLVEYSSEWLARDLARAMREGQLESSTGARMDLLPTAFPRDGLRINLPGGARIVGHIRFLRTEQ